MKPPNSDSDYTPEHAASLDAALRTARAPRQGLTASEKLPAVIALVQVLKSAVTILQKRIDGESEPYPGAARAVSQQALDAIELARKGGLLS